MKVIIAVLVSMFLLCGCNDESKQQASIFSWHQENIIADTKTFFTTLKELNIDSVYQYFSSSLSDQEIKEFVDKCDENKIDLYYLCGEKEYGLIKNQAKWLNEVDQVLRLQQITHKQIKGVVFDVEPYLLDEYDQDPLAVMDQFVENGQAAYNYAKENSLEVILCIPYYYDHKGYHDQLEKLVKECCDQLAIMNYYRKDEAKHIQDEVKLCKQYNKQCINIYEFNDGKGITKQNTYHDIGLTGAYDNFTKLKEKLADDKLKLSLHDYDAIRELLENE